jgi:hypothetical protein
MKSLRELFRVGIGPSSSHTMGPKKAAEAFVKRASDADRYKVTLYECYPLNVGIIDASYGQNNAFTTCTVTMAFKSWQPVNNSTQVNRSAS